MFEVNILKDVARVAERDDCLTEADVKKVANSIIKACRRHLGLRAELLARGKWETYIYTSLRRAYNRRCPRPQALPPDAILSAAEHHADSSLGIEDAQLLVLGLRPIVGDDGNFALDVLLSGRPLEAVAKSAGVANGTAASHFRLGLMTIRSALLRLLDPAEPATAFDEFVEAVALLKQTNAAWTVAEACLPHRVGTSSSTLRVTQDGHALRSRLSKYRIRHGAMRYRLQLAKLAPIAQRVVWMFESAGRPDEIIDALARGVTGAGGRALTADEWREGERLFRQSISNIRRVLSE